MTSDDVRRAQTLLVQLGYLPERIGGVAQIDGIPGKNTAAAVRAFWKALDGRNEQSVTPELLKALEATSRGSAGTQPKPIQTAAALLVERAKSYIGTKERGGKNRGPEIDRFNRTVGVALGSPWCLSFQYTVFEEVYADKLRQKNPLPRTAHCMTLYNMVRRGECPELITMPATKAQPGDLLILDHGGGKGHVEMVVERLDDGMLVTVGGNTNRAGSREGDGVYAGRYSMRNRKIAGCVRVKGS